MDFARLNLHLSSHDSRPVARLVNIYLVNHSHFVRQQMALLKTTNYKCPLLGIDALEQIQPEQVRHPLASTLDILKRDGFGFCCVSGLM